MALLALNSVAERHGTKTASLLMNVSGADPKTFAEAIRSWTITTWSLCNLLALATGSNVQAKLSLQSPRIRSSFLSANWDVAIQAGNVHLEIGVLVKAFGFPSWANFDRSETGFREVLGKTILASWQQRQSRGLQQAVSLSISDGIVAPNDAEGITGKESVKMAAFDSVRAVRLSKDQIDLSWRPVMNALCYVIEWSKDARDWYGIATLEGSEIDSATDKSGVIHYIDHDDGTDKRWYRVQVEVDAKTGTEWTASNACSVGVMK